MKKIDLLVNASWVLPIAPENKTLNEYSLAISEGKIIDILPQKQAQEKYTSSDTKNFKNHVLMPSFVNAHTHLAMSYYKGLGDDLPLMTWLSDYIWPAEAATVSKDMVYDGTIHALAESIRSGVSNINDHYFYMPEVAKALTKSKLKGMLNSCIFNFGTPWAPTVSSCFEHVEETIKATENLNGIIAGFGPHSPYGTDDEIMQKCVDLAEQRNMKINIHLHESAYEVEEYKKIHGISPVERFYNKGWLNKNMIAIHMTCLTDSEIEMVAKSGASVVHCPESNMKLASGLSPIQKLIDKGVNVALGTDGAASNNDLDMLGEMRTGAFLGKIAASDPTALSAESLLQMATLNGAKALGIDNDTGSLEVGKSADFILIDLDRPETLPVYNPISQIVYSTCREQVTNMWVSGNQVMRSRQLLTINEEEIKLKQEIWKNKILKAIKNK